MLSRVCLAKSVDQVLFNLTERERERKRDRERREREKSVKSDIYREGEKERDKERDKEICRQIEREIKTEFMCDRKRRKKNLADFYEIKLWIFPLPQTNHDLAWFWLGVWGERKSDIMPPNVNMANLVRHGLTGYRDTDIRPCFGPFFPMVLISDGC